jgi:hypothetical protein
MKINSKKLLEFLKSQNCDPVFKKFHKENNGFLKAGNLQIFGNFRKDDGFFSGQIVDFTTLQQSVDHGDKVEVEIVIESIDRRIRKTRSLADVVQNFKTAAN